MKKNWTLGIVLPVAGLLLAVSCQTRGPVTAEDLLAMPAKRLSNYPHDLSLPVEQRIREAPSALVSHLREMDSNESYRPYMPSAAEKALFREYYRLLPESYRRLLSERLVGIYFMEPFTGGGMTDYVFDDAGSMYLILVFNAEVLRTPLDAWIARRDNSAFAPDAAIRATNGLGGAWKGLLHTLTHEASHAWDYFRHETPYVERHLFAAAQTGRVREPAPTSLTSGVWTGYSKPSSRFDFPLRSKLAFYGLGQALDPRQEARMYRELAETPFSSLYGSTTWAEDFAEAFTWPYLKEKTGVVYSVWISGKDGIAAVFRPMDNPLVLKRYATLRSRIVP